MTIRRRHHVGGGFRRFSVRGPEGIIAELGELTR
jgi:hypothetical protein